MQRSFDNQEALRLFKLQNAKDIPCNYPGCTEPGQAHTQPTLCDRHEIICRVVGMRSRPTWGGQLRLILAEDITAALRRINPGAMAVLQEELDHFIDAYSRAP